MSIQNNLSQIKANLVNRDKSQPITVGEAIVISNALLELYGAIQSIPVPNLQQVLDSGNTADIGLTVADITFEGGSSLSNISILGDEPITPNGLLRFVVGGAVCTVQTQAS